MMKKFLLVTALGIAPALNAAEFSDTFKQGLECQRQGLLNQAVVKLEKAKSVAQSTDEQNQISGALGRTYYQFHQFELAKPLLEQAYQNSSGLQKADYANLLGNLHSNQHENKQAQTYYTQAAQLAKGDAVLTMKVALNLARNLDAATHLEALQKLSSQLNSIADVSERAELSLSVGEQAKMLGKDGLALAYDSFEKARLLSEKSPRIQTLSLDGLASLYEENKRIDDALRLTRQAIALMQANEGRDILFNLEWRQGRLLRQNGQIDAATFAYQRAVQHLEAIRQDIPVDYQNGRSSFRETLEPVYLGLADLLLEQAKKSSGDNQQQLLKKARDTVELIKQTELEDFLGNRCAVQSARQQIEQLDTKTAIVYPIILPQRLELLVSTEKGMTQFVIPVDSVTVRNQAQKMARNLRNRLPATMATKLYSWLVAPAENLLKEQGIETLVFVPDGALRLIPMSALYDGKQFLIEKYAVATSPGLTLFDAKPLEHTNLKTLLLGMSNPGDVVKKLPAKAITGFIEVGDDTPAAESGEAKPGTEKRGLGTRSVAEKSRALREIVKLHNGSLEQAMRSPEFIAGVQDQLKLPGVKQEVTTLQSQSEGNTLLLDEDFSLANFKNQVVVTPFSIVHIASHGIFNAKAENTFVMTHDDLLHIDDLEFLLRSEKFKKDPLQLLTLSACQTAEGDDRAPLGFTGVALKANARSAMGTLWPISDEAAFTLMTQFYKNINTMSKVKALQQAQLSLIKNPEMRNPFYWSPFILVGNWL